MGPPDPARAGCPARVDRNVNEEAASLGACMNVTELLSGGERAETPLDAVLSSPSLFLLALGSLMILVALVVQTGTWPALIFIFGVSLLVAGAVARVVRAWSRRKST